MENKWICEYCGNKFKIRKELYAHFKICEEKLKLPHDKSGRILKPERHIKRLITFHKHYIEGKIVPWNKGKKNTPEHNAHIAEGTIRFLNKQLEEQGKILFPRVNTVGCVYIDELNKKYNWHLQHGLNGGEIHVGPYSLDGYDKELNIVFEYDEPQHYIDVMNNILTEHDLNRMQYIKEQLHCRFFRYNEKLNLLYEC